MVLLGVSACGGDLTIAPPTASSAGSAVRADSAQRALDDLAAAVRAGRAAGDAGALVQTVTGNARRLGIRDLWLSYLDGDGGALSSAQRRRFGADAWVGTVQVTYRLTADAARTRMEVAVTFDLRHARTIVVAIGDHGRRSPLWLRGQVHVERGPGTLVVLAEADGDGSDVAPLARRAVRQVRRVIPRWHGILVVEVPATQDELESVLDAPAGTYAAIAAVTTSVDGSRVPGSPVHIFVNPNVFGTLGHSGAQVVITHEATHVATGAPFADMPTWLLEGFADYVALAHADVPVHKAAAQILQRVRRHGPPRRLPTAADLAPSAGGLGATYEEAWLACRYLAGRFGQAKLIALYRAATDGTPVPRLFEALLGISQRQFVEGWRVDLRRLAR